MSILLLAAFSSEAAHASEPAECSFLLYDGSGAAAVATVDLSDEALVVDETPLALNPTRTRGLHLDGAYAWLCHDGELHVFDRASGEGEPLGRACDAVAFGESTLLLTRPGTPTTAFTDVDEASDPEVDPVESVKIGLARVGASANGLVWTSWGTGNRVVARNAETWAFEAKLVLDRTAPQVWGMYATDATLYVLDDGQGETEWSTPAIRSYDLSTGEEVGVVELAVDPGKLPRGLSCGG